jgi:predicted RNase H-like nuclease
MRLLGIDLGWRSQPSGVCCLEWGGEYLEIIDLRRLAEITEVLDWVAIWADCSTGVAIDAPTIITNATGMRECDRLTHCYFGKYDAGCYPANLASPFADRLLNFSKRLEMMGFGHGARLTPRSEGKWQIEVFPHPATVQLFGLPKILKYKKGKVKERSSALRQLHGLICSVMPHLEPALAVDQEWLSQLEFDHLTGKELKNIEDQLDSLICAYIAAHWWYWGAERNLVLGSMEEGFLIVPNPPHKKTPPDRES